MPYFQVSEGTDAIVKLGREFGIWAALVFILLAALGYFIKRKMDNDTELNKQLVIAAEKRAEEDRKSRHDELRTFLSELAATRQTYLNGQSEAIRGQEAILREIRELKKRGNKE